MSLISAGTLRRLTQPILFKYWFTRGTLRESVFRIDRLEIRVRPSVFHPKYFGSSIIFARFIQSLHLEHKRFLDMGTGSGIVGLHAARAGATVTAVDINPEAVRCATELGFTRRRVLWRMRRGEAIKNNDAMVYAIAGFELG